jgi:multidrug resistance protein, MATE family
MRQPLGHHIRRTLILALPVMLARAGLVVMLTVDTVLVGRAGGHELAHFAISTAPQLIMMTIGTGLLLSTVVLTAQADGAGRQAECGRIWQLALMAAGLIGVVFGLLQWRGDLLLHLLGESDEIAAGGGRVSQMWALGIPAAMLYIASTSFLEGISRPRVAMVVSLSANLVNITLAWALVFGHGGLSALGAPGAALATAMTYWFMFLAVALYALTMRDADRYGVRGSLAGHYHLIGKLLLLGLPVALSISFETSAFSGATVIAGWIGETALAAYQLSINVTSFFYMLTLGLATAAAVRVGNAIGAGDHREVAAAGWVAVALVCLLMLVIAVGIRFFRADIAAIYTGDPAVVAAALPMLGVLSLLVVLDGIQGVLMGALRGAADVLYPMVTYGIAFWGCAIPFSYYLGYRLQSGAVGLAWGLIAGLAVASLLLGLRFTIVARRPRSAY